MASNIYENRKIFAVLFVINLLISLGFGMSDSFFTVYYTGLGATGMLVGCSVASYQISKILTGVAIGSGRINNSPVLMLSVSAVMYLFVSVAYLLSSSLIWLILLRFIQGAACASFRPSLYSLLNVSLCSNPKGKTFGTFDISFYAAAAAAPVTGGIIINRFGFSALYYMLIGLCLAALFLIRFVCSERGKISEEPAFIKSDSSLSLHEAALHVFIFGKAVTLACFTVYFPLFLIKECGLSALDAGYALSLSGFVMVFFLRPMGRLSDRVRKEMLIFSGGMGVALIFILMPDRLTFRQSLILAVFNGAFGAVSQPASVAMLLTGTDERSAAAVMGRFNSVFSIGYIAGSFLCSYIADGISVRAAFLAAGIFSTATLAMFFAAVLFQRLHCTGKDCLNI